MIEQEMFTHLRDNVTSVGGRVFANVFHQDTVSPKLVFTRRDRIDDVTCADPVRQTDWEIDVYADDYLDAVTIREETIAALAAFGHDIREVVSQDGFDEPAEQFVQIITFQTNT